MSKNLYSWIWKWHFIGGIVSLPIVALLAVTGIIYLFKEDYEAPKYKDIKTVEVQSTRVSYQQQWEVAKKSWDKAPNAVVVPQSITSATEFVSGRFSHKSGIFISPYTGEVSGKIQLDETDMHQVRKLHGELLLGSYGTKVVELIACWMVVLLITGVYIFWPRERGLKGLFIIRTKSTKRVLYRDLHTVTGFWFSLVLLLILAGGLPWTDVFGSSFRWVQEKTNTGYPSTWEGRAFTSEVKEKALPLDTMIKKAKSLNLGGEVTLHLPLSDTSVFSVSNQTSDLETIRMFHFDQYSGELIHSHTWEDIGSLMKIRLWVMAFHQGQFGLWNWLLVLFTAVALIVLSISALLSYLKRKSKGSWSIPKVPEKLNVGIVVPILIIILGIVLPLFGLSVLVIGFLTMVFPKKRRGLV